MSDLQTTASTEPGAPGSAAAVEAFRAAFGSEPTLVAHAPGRVNLLGEHTDYNDGFVLPIAIAQRTSVAIGPMPPGGGDTHELVAPDLSERVRFGDAERPASPAARYVWACLREADAALGAGSTPLPRLRIHVASTVPMGVGLSSSAALDVAMLRALRTLLALEWDEVTVALAAQRVEEAAAGVRCGVMDPMACALAGTDRALFLDTRTLATRLVALPPGAELLVLDSGLPRTLAGSAYNQRRAECEEAARRLGVPALRDVTDPSAADALPEPLNRRARHVITENARVRSVTGDGGAPAFVWGGAMNASHASLRDDFEVSVPALDGLVARLQAHPSVHGARLTGAGFGGACVALVAAGERERVADEVLAGYTWDGGHGRRLVP